MESIYVFFSFTTCMCAVTILFHPWKSVIWEENDMGKDFCSASNGFQFCTTILYSRNSASYISYNKYNLSSLFTFWYFLVWQIKQKKSIKNTERNVRKDEKAIRFAKPKSCRWSHHASLRSHQGKGHFTMFLTLTNFQVYLSLFQVFILTE